MSNRFTIRRQRAMAATRAKAIDAELAARPGVNDRVVVGPIQEAGRTIGLEGSGLIEAIEGEHARVLLDDGRRVLGVRRYRLAHAPEMTMQMRRANANEESECK